MKLAPILILVIVLRVQYMINRPCGGEGVVVISYRESKSIEKRNCGPAQKPVLISLHLQDDHSTSVRCRSAVESIALHQLLRCEEEATGVHDVEGVHRQRDQHAVENVCGMTWSALCTTHTALAA